MTTAAAVNQQIRAVRGANGELLILGAWCETCKSESPPRDVDGTCGFCGEVIVDYDTLNSRELAALVDGKPAAKHEEPHEPPAAAEVIPIRPDEPAPERTLQLAPDVALPLDVAGEAIAILAKRGAGKTNTGRVLAEELVGAGVQTVVIDPVGAWWGLRSSADGKGEGLALPILGGVHGDADVKPWMGSICAWSVVEEGQSLILDLSDLSRDEQRTFLAAFAEDLYRLKARNHALVHVILEEADEFAPQSGPRASRSDEQDPRAAIETLARRGRSRGIGLTMITQRSAALSKDVLTQADVLIAMRTTGPSDVKAIEAWIAKNTDGADEVIASLPGLQTGEGWIWNPERSILRRARFRLARTFDSSSTPKFGVDKPAPEFLTAVEVPAIKAEQPLEESGSTIGPAYKQQGEDGMWGCKTPDCDGRARHRAGPYAYLCDDCKGRKIGAASPADDTAGDVPEGKQESRPAGEAEDKQEASPGQGTSAAPGVTDDEAASAEVSGQAMSGLAAERSPGAPAPPMFGVTGYFGRDAEQMRSEARRLRDQADVLDRIAEQLDLLNSMQEGLF